MRLAACLTPAAVIVSALIGGGYGTGREAVEFFTSYGVVGGLYGIAVSSCVFAVVLVLSFEFSRVFKAYDYRHFLKALVGPGWIAFEILYILLFLMVVGVLLSAAGNMLADHFGLPLWMGGCVLLVLMIAMVIAGRTLLERAVGLWFGLMLAVFAIYFARVWSVEAGAIGAAVASGDAAPDWMIGGLLYPMYNLAAGPVLLFSARGICSRGEAVFAGVLTAALIIAPLMLFHLSFAAHYPEITEQPVPNYWLIGQIGPSWLLTLFLIALFGTLVQTGAAMMQGLIERIDGMLLDRGAAELTRVQRFVATGLLAAICYGASTFGIVALVGQGYSAMAVGFALVYVLPICTIGVYKLMRAGSVHGSAA